MSKIDVYLEIGTDGTAMAHVLSLPGCFTKASSEEAALAAVPQAVWDYWAWLGEHGEEEPEPNVTGARVVEVSEGFGPFVSGDAAALFAPDEEPISAAEMELYLRRWGYVRADLLTLARDLPADVLKCLPPAAEMSIGEILRHIAIANRWLASRILNPTDLRPQWGSERRMAVFRFLDTIQRTATAHIRQLTDEQRAQVAHPTDRTEHPEEPWTARKMLRRLIEHEWEHTDEILGVLAGQRKLLLARMATARSGFFWAMRGVDERTLVERPIMENLTSKDLLAHVAYYDDIFTRRVELLLEGRGDEIVPLGDLAANNAQLYDERKDWSLALAVAACVEARANCLAQLAQASDQQLYQPYQLFGATRWMYQWVEFRYRHDGEHGRHLARLQKLRQKRDTGPKYILGAILAAARDELLTCAALVPEAERETHPVCGEWTLKEVLGHLTDWEAEGVEVLRRGAKGLPVDLAEMTDDETWNRKHAAARQGQSWDDVWTDFEVARHNLLMTAEEISDDEMCRPLASPWSDTVYGWVAMFAAHDREHATEIRKALELGWPPRLMR